MGGATPGRFSREHILHHAKPDENRLYLFDTYDERFFNFPCFWKAKPFFFGSLSLIMVPQHARLFVVGGLGYSPAAEFKYLRRNPSRMDLPGSRGENLTLEVTVAPEDFSVLDGDSEESLSFYAKLENSREELLPSTLVGYFEVSRTRVGRLNFSQEHMEQFEVGRAGHVIVYAAEWIYIFGGAVEGQAVGGSKKLHVEQGVMVDISSIDPAAVRGEPGAIAVRDNIFIFNALGESQTIYKYSISFDVWEQLAFRTPGFVVPPTARPSLFQIDRGQLIYLNGRGANEMQHINYFVFSLENDSFVQERSDRKLLRCIDDGQGNRDYTSSHKIYTHLSDARVKVFFKQSWMWDNIEIYFIRVKRERPSSFNLRKLPCFAGRK